MAGRDFPQWPIGRVAFLRALGVPDFAAVFQAIANRRRMVPAGLCAEAGGQGDPSALRLDHSLYDDPDRDQPYVGADPKRDGNDGVLRNLPDAKSPDQPDLLVARGGGQLLCGSASPLLYLAQAP